MAPASGSRPPLLLIHPIGVGLSSRFWDRFIRRWQNDDPEAELLAPDLIGCGEAACSRDPLTPHDWALLQKRNGGPAVIVTQGTSLPIALALIELVPDLVCGLVAVSPPGWRVLQEEVPIERSRQLWRWLFRSPIGNIFYLYARRRSFLQSFSRKNLFAEADAVDEQWLQTLREGSRSMDTRWAVYSFLAGFWRRDWEPRLTGLTLPLQAAGSGDRHHPGTKCAPLRVNGRLRQMHPPLAQRPATKMHTNLKQRAFRPQANLLTRQPQNFSF